jgi:hypothetical protein
VLSPAFLKDEQSKDADCQRWRAPLEDGTATADYPFVLKDGLLFRKGDGKRLPEMTLRIALPLSLRFTALQHCHDHPLAGHLKLAKTFSRLEERFWWEGMYRKTKEWVQACRQCQQRAAPPRVEARLPLIPIPVSKPFTAVVTDFLGPFPLTKAGNRYVVVVTDRFTNWVIAWATPDINAATEAGVITESNSPWSSPVVLVKKPDGSWRYCIDYRKLNAVTKKDSYPLPLISEVLDRLQGAVWFSSLDLKAGYWQIAMDEQDAEKTAFTTPQGGLYHFNVLSFGLCNAPATFCRLMDVVLSGLNWKECMVYVDDIVVFSKTWE